MNKKFKKVTGERLIAALIDSFVIGFVSSIISFVYMFKDGFDAYMDNIESNMTTTSSIFGVYGIDFYIFSAVIAFLFAFAYFVYVPYKWNGQTIGKKLMKVKVIDEFGNNPSLGKHFIRAIQGWDAFVGLFLLPIIIYNLDMYVIVLGVIGGIITTITVISIIVFLAREDGRGLHDNMAGTFVVKSDVNLEEEFIEKATQLSEWAEVDYNFDRQDRDDDKDDWI